MQPRSRWRKVSRRLYDEWKAFIRMAFYLYVIFASFALYEAVVLHEHGFRYEVQGLAIFNALCLGKIMAVAEHMRIARWLPNRPLVYRILFEGAAFSLLFLCFYIVEKMIRAAVRGQDVLSVLSAEGGAHPERLAAAAAIMFVMLLPFFAFRNVSRELGQKRLEAMIFGGAAEDGEAGSPSA